MSLYQKMLMFYAVMAAIAFLITWFLSHDKKRIRFLSAFLVGATWPMSFPVALLFSADIADIHSGGTLKPLPATRLAPFGRLQSLPADADIPCFPLPGYTAQPASHKHSGWRRAPAVLPDASDAPSAGV